MFSLRFAFIILGLKKSSFSRKWRFSDLNDWEKDMILNNKNYKGCLNSKGNCPSKKYFYADCQAAIKHPKFIEGKPF